MMTDQEDTGAVEARQHQTHQASNFARQAVHSLASHLGAPATSRPMFRHDATRRLSVTTTRARDARRPGRRAGRPTHVVRDSGD
jgi:hypothetical protein